MFDTLHLLEGDTSVCGRHSAWSQESYVDPQETRCLFVEAHCQRAGDTLLGRRRQMPVGRGSTACLRGTHWLFAGGHCKLPGRRYLSAGDTLRVTSSWDACSHCWLARGVGVVAGDMLLFAGANASLQAMH